MPGWRTVGTLCGKVATSWVYSDSDKLQDFLPDYFTLQFVISAVTIA